MPVVVKFSCVVLALLLAGCAHRHVIAPTSRPDRVFQTLEILQSADETLQGTIAISVQRWEYTKLTRNGAHQYAYDVSQAIKAITAALKGPGNQSDRSKAALAALDRLRMPPSVARFIEDPGDVATFQTIAAAVVTVRQLVVQLRGQLREGCF
jgi:hypothetical protein